MARKQGRPYACPWCGQHRVWAHTLEQVRNCRAQYDAGVAARRVPRPRQTTQVLAHMPLVRHPLILTEGTVKRLQGNQRGGLKNKGHRWTSEQARAAALLRYRHPHTGRVYPLARQSWVKDLPALRAQYRAGRILNVGSQLALVTCDATGQWTMRVGETGDERPITERRVLVHLGLTPDRHKRKHVKSMGVPVTTTPLPDRHGARARAHARLRLPTRTT